MHFMSLVNVDKTRSLSGFVLVQSTVKDYVGGSKDYGLNAKESHLRSTQEKFRHSTLYTIAAKWNPSVGQNAYECSLKE